MSVAFHIFKAALRDVFTNLGAVFKTVCVPALCGVGILILFGLFAPEIASDETTVTLVVLLSVYAISVLASIAVKWFRFVLLDARPPWVLSWARRGAAWGIGWRMLPVSSLAFALIIFASIGFYELISIGLIDLTGPVMFLVFDQVYFAVVCFIVVLMTIVLIARAPPLVINRLERAPRAPFGHVFSISGTLTVLCLLLTVGFRGAIVLPDIVKALVMKFVSREAAFTLSFRMEPLFVLIQAIVCILLCLVMLSIVARVHLHLNTDASPEDVFG